ncbi:hypothetical protein N7456_009737 [Penicillium angulare]|uniref:Uncharacterized protein n=1 Tax=Penicillium angulare TaxID=116970 RepID=A0A9W9F5B2_9EURO|nr:hypothetical protein N7456_009737 [Penicillium angulare]
MVRPLSKSKVSKATRLPLSKFSHTTTTIDHSGPLSWTHVNDAEQLICVLEQVSTGPSTIPKLFMRVSQHDIVLEQLDLSHFIQRSSIQGPSNQGASQSKPPFAVVVKSPCLAVKYPQSASHIRRFQIKFSRNTDYFTALAFFSEANCSFTEGSTAITAQPLRRLPTSSSLASFQAPTIASKDASTTAPSENGATITHFPMSGYMRSGIPTPHPPSSTTSTVYNLAAQNAPPQIQDQYQNINSGQVNRQLTVTDSAVQVQQKVNASRTATAPAYHGNQLDEMLPPKRALPFLKPAHKAPLREISNVSAVSQYARSEGQVNDCSKNTQLLPLKINHALTRDNSQIADSQSNSPAPTQPYQDPPPSSQRQAPQLSEYSRPESAEQPHGVCEVEMNISHRPRENEKILGAAYTAQSKGIQPGAISAEQLSTYLSTPTPERIKMLENWMCELIEDDKFMELCQDVEATWKRFAFGARE